MKSLRRRRVGLSAAGLVASATAMLCVRSRSAFEAWKRPRPRALGKGDRLLNGPGGYAVDYPLREAIGDAELILKPDGSWSVSFTVVPVNADEGQEETSPDTSDLPPMVALVRSAISEAARARDFEALEQLAFTFGQEFTYSFEEPTVEGHPGRYWKELEDHGEGVLATLTQLLEMPHTNLGDVYVWPSVAVGCWQEVPHRDREALRRCFGEDQIGFWEEMGAYVDYRIGISAEGNWLFFVAGD